MKLRGIHIWLNFGTQGIKSITNIMNDQNNHFKKKKRKRGEDQIRAYQG